MEENHEKLLISHLTLRKTIGWLGMLLPFALIATNFLLNEFDLLNSPTLIDKICSKPYVADNIIKPSISHYYYSAVGEVFTGTISAVSLFMFCYRGHKNRKHEFGLSDQVLTNIIGLSALGIVIFPTSSPECITDNIRTFMSSRFSGTIHLVMAAIFFVSLSFMSIINFRRTKDVHKFGTEFKHKVILVCGISMLICIFIIFIYSNFIEYKYDWLDRLNPVFWLEAVALIFFGICWMIKGQVDFLYLFKMFKLNASNSK
jgi:hypothetical protein